MAKGDATVACRPAMGIGDRPPDSDPTVERGRAPTIAQAERRARHLEKFLEAMGSDPASFDLLDARVTPDGSRSLHCVCGQAVSRAFPLRAPDGREIIVGSVCLRDTIPYLRRHGHQAAAEVMRAALAEHDRRLRVSKTRAPAQKIAADHRKLIKHLERVSAHDPTLAPRRHTWPARPSASTPQGVKDDAAKLARAWANAAAVGGQRPAGRLIPLPASGEVRAELRAHASERLADHQRHAAGGAARHARRAAGLDSLLGRLN